MVASLESLMTTLLKNFVCTLKHLQPYPLNLRVYVLPYLRLAKSLQIIYLLVETNSLVPSTSIKKSFTPTISLHTLLLYINMENNTPLYYYKEKVIF